ncbi:PPPDE peptidase domain-containing protein [Spironucleus salmonicida]|uniref:PPPDE peptidase domain-containing protein n=1 Tax=Spironucleus salmonicida TaxID=348837 RepID=V6LK54_9EUKA|nr:PPPDE peptidase domain-containing protein [Spironucleus salmonicida]|eukprot:EST44932.1 PPPDE peptidase domain-containing protein [Spironucleus salmonicida]
MPYTVTLHIYDLSQGIAAQLSKQLLNKEFKAVYHTGVSLHNTEYFFGQGIQTGVPLQTPFGKPIEQRVMGTTSKTVKDIYDWIFSQSTDFSESSYNAMTHNCNHFSSVFLTFLGIQGFPQEILEQPEEFLSTSLGSMFGNMFGGKSNSQPTITNTETPNKEYASLYITDPKVFICDDEDLINYIQVVSENDETKKSLNTILAAYNESQNYKTTFLLGQQNKIALYEVLALISTTSSIENIPEDLTPSNLIPSNETTLIIPFFRYLNNYFCNTKGMIDGRKNIQLFVPLMKEIIVNQDKNIKVAVLRSAFAMSRFFTPSMQKNTQFFEFLLKEAVAYSQQQGKESQICLNLCCGAIGRMLISFSSDAVLANELKLKVSNQLKTEDLKDSKAPCVRDLSKYISLKTGKKDDEEFF